MARNTKTKRINIKTKKRSRLRSPNLVLPELSTILEETTITTDSIVTDPSYSMVIFSPFSKFRSGALNPAKSSKNREKMARSIETKRTNIKTKNGSRLPSPGLAFRKKSQDSKVTLRSGELNLVNSSKNREKMAGNTKTRRTVIKPKKMSRSPLPDLDFRGIGTSGEEITIITDPMATDPSYSKVYTTEYMIDRVEWTANETKAEFEVPENWIQKYRPDIELCGCCLCKQRHSNVDTFEFCNRKKTCGPSHRILIGSYAKKVICDQCINMLVNRQKKHKKCIFPLCDHEKSQQQKKHFLFHLKAEKNWLCNLCEKGFTSQAQSSQHERSCKH